ncbi:tRNA pseudouridine(55) synthase TruB [Allosphingosinicella vermicomposti]|uniref:tRNA pseudouridine(55) synthase TruB n=1 Tax=Allosphingosinicella vermicomposti TaxID=614671 RepID=UPI000D0EE2CB|nr:tRNA pseudouridine(55) synthase TruB [Allosphingosinicella vermicomposti]
MHGWLIIDKPLGPGSTDIVSAVKRALRAGGYTKMKVGHGGTLDPLASGVLPVALGEATKLSGRMLDADKVYDFTIRFGEETSTLDAEGEVVATSDVRPALADVEAVLSRFTGPIEQVPPIYSALKVGGKRAYDLARAGEEVTLAARQVTIHSLSILPPTASPEPVEGRNQLERASTGSALAGEGELRVDEITLTARVSKGTYIRSLARDIAYALDTVGHVTMLRRTKAGPFTLESAISLDKLGEAAKARELEHILLPLAAGLDDIPALPVTPDQAGALRQGRKLIGFAAKPGLHLAIENHVPVALVELCEEELRVVRGFNL